LSAQLAGQRPDASAKGIDLVGRFKRFNDMLVVAPPRKAVGEVSVRELSRSMSAVLARVRAGGRVVVTKHGAPAAVLMEVEEAVGLCATVLLSRREAERRLFGDELDAIFRHRVLSQAPRILGGE
jgi:prevent-host-death family protein